MILIGSFRLWMFYDSVIPHLLPNSLARQRTLEDEEEQQRERRRRHRSLLSSSSVDEDHPSPGKDPSPAPSRWVPGASHALGAS